MNPSINNNFILKNTIIVDSMLIVERLLKDQRVSPYEMKLCLKAVIDYDWREILKRLVQDVIINSNIGSNYYGLNERYREKLGEML